MSGLRDAWLAGVAGALVTAAVLFFLLPTNDFEWAVAGLTVVVMAAAIFKLRRGRSDGSGTERSMWQ